MPAVVRFRSVVIDCPDPRALAAFYAGLLGGTPQVQDEDWVVLEPPGAPRLAFNREPDHRPPAWPRAGADAQQFHLDLNAGSTWAQVDEAQERALALGARPLDVDNEHDEDPDRDHRVLRDPAGHPFCLCRIDEP